MLCKPLQGQAASPDGVTHSSFTLNTNYNNITPSYIPKPLELWMLLSSSALCLPSSTWRTLTHSPNVPFSGPLLHWNLQDLLVKWRWYCFSRSKKGLTVCMSNMPQRGAGGTHCWPGSRRTLLCHPSLHSWSTKPEWPSNTVKAICLVTTTFLALKFVLFPLRLLTISLMGFERKG